MSQEDSIGRAIIVYPPRPRIKFSECSEMVDITVKNRFLRKAHDGAGTFDAEP